MTGRTKEKIAQNKRARAGSLALVDSHKWRELYPPGVWFADDAMTSFSGVTFVLFVFLALLCFVFRLHYFVEAVALRSIVLRYAGAPIATRVSFFFFLLFLWRCRFFRVFFWIISAFFVWRVRRTFFPSKWCFFTL